MCPLRARSNGEPRGATGKPGERRRNVQVTVSPGQLASEYAIFQTGAPPTAPNYCQPLDWSIRGTGQEELASYHRR